MKLLLLVAFVAACTASSLVRTRTVSVGDDGSYLINNSLSGRRVQIYRPTVGENSFEINVSGPNFPSKVIRIYENPEYSTENEVSDEVRQKRSFSKIISGENGDVFFLILRDYVGPVTESQWDKFLTRVQAAVRQGVVVPEIYDILVGLDFVEANYIWQAIQNGERVFGQYQQRQSGYESSFFGRTPSQYYQSQGPYQYQYQGPYSSQIYQGQYPYFRSQYYQQSPRSAYPFFTRSNDLSVNQQPFQGVPTQYSRKSVDVNTVPQQYYGQQPLSLFRQYQQQYYGEQPQSYLGQYFQRYFSQQQPQSYLYNYLQNIYGQQRPQTYLGQYNQYYGQEQPQSYLSRFAQSFYGQQQPRSYLEQYYGQQGQSQNFLGRFLQQYYGQRTPVYGQQQQYYGQYYPYSQQYSSYPYQQNYRTSGVSDYQVPQTVY